MTIGNTIVNDKKWLFESVLIKHIAKHDDFMNDYDRLALYLSADSGKNIDGRKITYMSRGEAYAKKWLILCLLKTALVYGWLPNTPEDWMHIIWTLTGKRQSVYGGDNTLIYEKLADMSGKPECVFEQKYAEMLQESQYDKPK